MSLLKQKKTLLTEPFKDKKTCFDLFLKKNVNEFLLNEHLVEFIQLLNEYSFELSAIIN